MVGNPRVLAVLVLPKLIARNLGENGGRACALSR